LVKKQDLPICCLQKTHLTESDKCWLRVKEWKNIFQTNGPHEQVGVAILKTDEVDFRLKSVITDNEGHFILIKGTIHQN
jgi:hypothetical protein